MGAVPRRPPSSPRGNKTNGVTARNPSYTHGEEITTESPPQPPGTRIKTSGSHGGGAAGAHERLSRPPCGCEGGFRGRVGHLGLAPSPTLCPRGLQEAQKPKKWSKEAAPQPPTQLSGAGRCPQAPSPSRPVPAGPVRGQQPRLFLPLSGSDI